MTHPRMIIFLYGDDTYRSRQKLREIKDKFNKEVDPTGLQLVEIDGETLTLEDFHSAVAPVSLFARRRMVIVRDLLSKSKKKTLQADLCEILPKYKDEETVIVFWEGTGKVDGHLFQFLLKQPVKQEFKPLQAAALKKWISEYLKPSGVKILPEAADLLVRLADKDLYTLENELKKLSAYSRQKVITPNEVKLLVKGKYDDFIFHLIDAMGERNKNECFRLLRQQRLSGANDMYLLSMISRHVRVLLLVKCSLSRDNQSLNRFQLAAAVEEHPFVIQKAQKQADHFNIDQLRTLYSYLHHAEYMIKTGRGDGSVLIDIAMANFL